MRYALIAAAAVAVALLGWKFWSGGAADASVSAYTTVPAARGNLVARVTATGTLSARVTVQVGSQVSGRIAALYADFNSPVKKGEIIARLDPQLYEAATEQARANLAAAGGNLVKAKALSTDADRQSRRAAELFEQKLVSQADRDSAHANLESARASIAVAEGSVAQARAALGQAKVNLAYTVITSPTDGVVISRAVDEGQTVAATLSAPTLFTIAQDLRKMEVHTNVAESDIGKLADDMQVSFTVDAYPSERFKGRIRQIRNAAQTVQNVVTYDAVIDVDNPDLRLKPGMTANASFVYAKRDNALLAPNAALRFRPPPELTKVLNPPKRAEGRGDGPPNERTLWVLREGQPVALKVQTGVSDGSQTEILGAELNEGDLLITDAPGAKAKQQQPPMGRMF